MNQHEQQLTTLITVGAVSLICSVALVAHLYFSLCAPAMITA